MKIQNVRDHIEELLKQAGFTEEQLLKLRDMKFYKAPASSRYHSAYDGGLAVHSLEVYKTASTINKALNLKIKENSIIISCILHDLNKVYRYTYNTLKNGTVSQTQPYKVDAVLIGDGELSAFLIGAVLKYELTPQEYHAIRFHNIFEDSYKTSYFPQLQKDSHYLSNSLTWLLQMSDLYAATVKKI